MKKDIFISKFNMKNYSNGLEKSLSKKPFSVSTKNLLSDMLYKIENAYEDYRDVKIEVKPKSAILEELINIIENDCKEVEIIKEKTSSSNREEGKITTFLNAKRMLYELYQIKQKKFRIESKYDIIKKSLESTLNQGYSMNGNEIIRDFGGWAWNVQEDEIEDKINNFLYQTMLLLVGNNFLCEWQNNEVEDYIIKLIEVLEKKYKTEKADKILRTILQISIINYTNKNPEERKRLIEIEKDLTNEYKYVNDKQEYLKEISEKKKNINKQICTIDEIISNDRQLKQEFIRRNELLSSSERIFSLSNFVEILQGEKAGLMKKLNECNRKMEPLNFMKMKLEIENKLQILNEIDLSKNSKTIYKSKIEELIKLVCETFKIQVDNFIEKEEITEVIYKIRYYKSIPIMNNKKVQDLHDFRDLEKYVITIACKEKVLNIISKNIQENYEIIKNIFKTDIIKLEKIYIVISKIEHIYTLEIFEEENKNASLKLDKVEELNINENKRTKLFI